MSDTVWCPHCAATTGAKIPLPVIITPIKGGVHVESYRPCPECNRTVCYDQITEEPPAHEMRTVGWLVEWAYNDGERAGSGSRTFAVDELEEAEAYCARMAQDPDNHASLWPIEKEIKTPLEYCEDVLGHYNLGINAPTPRAFGWFKNDLKRDLEDLLAALREQDLAWEAALTEEIQITLQIIETKEDLAASGLQGDILQIKRRLTE